jgi:lysine-N-methylase
LTQPDFIAPQYAGSFHCIGSDCEDTCCHGWKVPVDRDAFMRFQNLPAGPLRTLIEENLEPGPAQEDSPSGKTNSAFAIIRMTAENHCPMLSEDRLCRIQSEYGVEYLPQTCATYPRVMHTENSVTETALTLSCPEAARLVLLHPNLLGNVAGSETIPGPLQKCEEPEGDASLRPWRGAIRNLALTIAANRAYPLWQRLFLLGVFCRRLDAILASKAAAYAGEPQPTPAAFLADFEAAVASGALRNAMQSLPADDKAQLDAVLQLAGLMLHKSNIGPRFAACIHAFTTGIGNGPGATLESLSSAYAAARSQYFAPFFHRNPHILENLLVNTILRLRFPFGFEKEPTETDHSMNRQFALLAAQFALIRGLLIGVSGFHREAFAVEHIVHTVQSASKHFEHHPEFLKQVYAWLVEHGLDNARGLTLLLNESVSM